ncbi:hypothetical protein FACS1894158_02260 [Betaproteobacteria bacterium]|nr:hypothetical protein FACS1894158_02260 [Betaproteobacteria bacterium]
MVLSDEKRDLYLCDFVAWVKVRRPISKKLGHGDSLPSDDALEYIAGEIDRMIKNGKPPFERKKGRKKQIAWDIYHRCNFANEHGDKTALHIGGVFSDVSTVFNKSPETIKTTFYKARERLLTPEGKIEYLNWILENDPKEKGWNTVRMTFHDGKEAQVTIGCNSIADL